MARPNRSDERRLELIRPIAATFAELGYRRTTTAILAERCGLQEVVLYRLWPDKKAMFVAAIGFVGANTERIWDQVAGSAPGGTRAAQRTSAAGSGAERLLAHEATHLGEFGFHRILFAGFSETDDPDIHAALRSVYERLLQRIGALVAAHRSARGSALDRPLPPALLTAWALVGLGTATNLGRELGMLDEAGRTELFAAIGRHLLG
ncbi:MAG: TetR family transcriptional regulator [Planctomycetota bacterium]